MTNSGVQGYKNICSDNQIRVIGAQEVKGSGIRVQNSDCTIQGNIVQDVGICGISGDDSNGSSYNKFIGNSIEGLNILGIWGILVATFGRGHRVIGNTIKDFKRGVGVECGANTLISTLIQGNSISTTAANSFGFAFEGGGTIAGVMISGNDVDLPASGNIVLNNNAVIRVNLRDNDFTPATSNGAGNVLGSATGITFASNP